MPRIARAYTVRFRPDKKTWQVTLNPTSGLPRSICQQWQRRRFSSFPNELARYRTPANQTQANNAALRLIEYLKQAPDVTPATIHGPTVDEWLKLFLDPDTSPRAQELVAKNRPYSPDTIEGYNEKYNTHLKGDLFLDRYMNDVEQSDVLAFLSRMAKHQVREGQRSRDKKTKTLPGRTIEGTRTYEMIYSFVRMAFLSYHKKNPRWLDPFIGLDRPKAQVEERVGLEDHEVIKLFTPNVLLTPMERAVCAAMFWAGLRRSEIFGLLPEDLDWTTPQINVRHAWKRFDSKDRTLGGTKSHKARKAPFPDLLQSSIKALWEYAGKHEFVFSFKDGTQPTARWFSYPVGLWFKRAGIEMEGRRITPHSARHSFASIMEEQGYSLRYIQEMLGHYDLKTTKNYLHTSTQTINKITSYINSLTESQEDLQTALKDAIAVEDYEKAAIIRDRLREVK